MEMYHSLIVLLHLAGNRRTRHCAIVQKPYFDLGGRVVFGLILVELCVLSPDLLNDVPAFELFACHAVVRNCLLKCQHWSEHGHVELAICRDLIENDFGALFDELVIIDQVEE